MNAEVSAFKGPVYGMLFLHFSSSFTEFLLSLHNFQKHWHRLENVSLPACQRVHGSGRYGKIGPFCVLICV